MNLQLFSIFLSLILPPGGIYVSSGNKSTSSFLINLILFLSSVMLYFLYKAGIGVIIYGLTTIHAFVICFVNFLKEK